MLFPAVIPWITEKVMAFWNTQPKPKDIYTRLIE